MASELSLPVAGNVDTNDNPPTMDLPIRIKTEQENYENYDEESFICNKEHSEATVHMKQEQESHDITHVEVKSEEKPFTISEDNESSSQEEDILQNSEIEENPFTCSECGKVFSGKYLLASHMKTHVKAFSCSYCGKALSHKSSLIYHMRKGCRSRNKPKIPSDNVKAFTQKDLLVSPKPRQSEEKPFKCDECGKSFSLKGNLKSHVQTHLNLKPFECKECGKTFAYKKSLRQHMNKGHHSAHKPVKCNCCGKAFTRKIVISSPECLDKFILKNGSKKHENIHAS